MNNISILNLPFIFEKTSLFKIKFNLRIFAIFAFGLIGMLFSFYIFQVNDLALKTFKFLESQRQIRKLSLQKEQLEVEVAKVNELLNVENLMKKFNFEKAEKIHYIQIFDTQMVKE
jgi:hypothetical protein